MGTRKGINENIVTNTKRRLIKEFLDLVILRFTSEVPCSGYDIISHIVTKYGIMVSSGVVYGTLYALERNQLLLAYWNGRKRIYKLSPEGKDIIRKLHCHLDLIVQHASNFFGDFKMVEIQ
jgi:DNA-binding PadR family transcriptional regulator